MQEDTMTLKELCFMLDDAFETISESLDHLNILLKVNMDPLFEEDNCTSLQFAADQLNIANAMIEGAALQVFAKLQDSGKLVQPQAFFDKYGDKLNV